MAGKGNSCRRSRGPLTRRELPLLHGAKEEDMKKILLIVLVMACMGVLLYAPPSFSATWSVTVTWGRSVGPNLQREEVFYNSISKCTVLPAAPTTCNFVIPTLGGEVWVRSFNAQGAFADTSHVQLQPEPAAATGVSVTVTYVP